MTKWTDIKLRQMAEHGRWKCEWCGKAGKEAHHGIFGAKKAHKEYDCAENMVILCHRCNVSKVLDNKDGRLWSLEQAVKRYSKGGHDGKDHMRAWLESLKETHKVHDIIDYYQRVLED